MPFTLEQFIAARPFLYHLTDQSNVSKISKSRTLHSASNLMRQAGDIEYLHQKRTEHIAIQIENMVVKIRDQQPLYAGNILFENNWSFEDVIHLLNERVFFWPGKDESPISYGIRHFERYADEQPAILRISTVDLFAANSGVSPFFCKYNSGSPRCTQGHGSPRGSQTFLNCGEANYTSCNVVEVTYIEQVQLPAKIEVADSFTGSWKPI